MAFFKFMQNNSGGVYIRNDDLHEIVVIECDEKWQAIEKALSIGIYFDGVDKDLDCACCGDRWSDSPTKHSSLAECLNYRFIKWQMIVHYADGTKGRFYTRLSTDE